MALYSLLIVNGFFIVGGGEGAGGALFVAGEKGGMWVGVVRFIKFFFCFKYAHALTVVFGVVGVPESGAGGSRCTGSKAGGLERGVQEDFWECRERWAFTLNLKEFEL